MVPVPKTYFTGIIAQMIWFPIISYRPYHLSSGEQHLSDAFHPLQRLMRLGKHDQRLAQLICCSTWVMVNTKTRRLAKIPEAMRVKLVDLAPKPHR